MKLKSMMISALSTLLIAGCQTHTAEHAPHATQAPQADANRIKAHLHFLADDLLKGRETGTHGHRIASLYVASEFAQYGLTPAGENGSFFQEVTFRKAKLDQDSPALTLTRGTENTALSYPNDYITSASTMYTNAAVSGELVFVGYGIVADELSHNDYEGLDVDGKIVVALSGKPKSFPSEEGAHFASGRQKAAYAAQRGAIGMITVSTPTAEKVRPYQNLLNYLHTPRLSWLDKEGNPANVQPAIKGAAYFSKHAAEQLFKDAPVSLESIYAQLEEDKSPRGFALNASVSMSKTSRHEEIVSPNVVGILPGSDPVLKDEYVVYSAHTDHIGVAKTVKKDKINNGAMDNASGTSIMLETARMFSEAAVRPRRSILFVAVTGEEKGLLGSDYFARNPTVPVTSMVANVNLDMPILTYEFADVIAFGANHSDMQASVSNAAQNAGVTLSADPWPEQALFTRSDHYSFVKQGIPAVFLVPGLKSADPEVDGSKQFGAFLSSHYHKPSDDINLPFNWQAATKFAQVNFEIGQTLANQQARPAWNKGDFFGETFAR